VADMTCTVVVQLSVISISGLSACTGTLGNGSTIPMPPIRLKFCVWG
jgi:hypothetical protein